MAEQKVEKEEITNVVDAIEKMKKVGEEIVDAVNKAGIKPDKESIISMFNIGMMGLKEIGTPEESVHIAIHLA